MHDPWSLWTGPQTSAVVGDGIRFNARSVWKRSAVVVGWDIGHHHDGERPRLREDMSLDVSVMPLGPDDLPRDEQRLVSIEASLPREVGPQRLLVIPRQTLRLRDKHGRTRTHVDYARLPSLWQVVNAIVGELTFWGPPGALRELLAEEIK